VQKWGTDEDQLQLKGKKSLALFQERTIKVKKKNKSSWMISGDRIKNLSHSSSLVRAR
jgi:hypothetical protein